MPSDRFYTTDADVILRSADGRKFPSHKIVLSLVSPVFRDMFSLPQPPSPGPAPIPVVDVCEAGKVLDMFLQCLYPLPKPTVDDFELMEALIVAADKYETKVVLKVVGSWLMAPENLRTDPLRVFAIACGSPDLRGLAGTAAKRLSFKTAFDGDLNTLALLTTIDYHCLLTYLERREKDAKTIADDPSGTIFSTPQCACRPKARLEIKEHVKKAVTDAFVSDPSLSQEGAVVLACKELLNTHACHSSRGCSLHVRGEEYAKALRNELVKMSDELWYDLEMMGPFEEI
jgi:hypothetical protein